MRRTLTPGYTLPMSHVESRDAAEDAANQPGLNRIFVAIVFVEIVTIAALYTFGRHFGQL
jgi:hypothetical protein